MTGRVESRLAELDLSLPPPHAPVATYEPFTVSGGLVFVSGQGPVWGTEVRFAGQIGNQLDIVAGCEAARLTTLNLLAHVKTACQGDLDRVKRCLKLFGLVNATASFRDADVILQAACDLLAELFGEAGKPAASVTVAPGLPVGIAVEFEALFEIA